jgi:hypothetical protein
MDDASASAKREREENFADLMNAIFVHRSNILPGERAPCSTTRERQIEIEIEREI